MMQRFVALCLGLLLLSGAGAPAAAALPSSRQWQDEAIYFLMIDRFHNGDRSNDTGVRPKADRGWHGGDLQGVIDKLDYIKSLGFTAVWITPHVQNEEQGYHGYHASDFFTTDPRFGTVALTKRLVEEAHARGLKVIFDIVINHTGPSSGLLRDHPDWFHKPAPITNWDDDAQLQNHWLFDLPDFDQSKPEVREYILSYSKFWIEQTGVDGFRIDTLRHLPPEFVQWWSTELRQVKPDFWLIGEAWESNSYRRLVTYQKSGVDALLNFPVSEGARAVFGSDASLAKLAAVVERGAQEMPDPTQLAAFLDNHDMERFVSIADNDAARRLKMGLVYLFTGRDIPILYYGTEIAMEGGADPDNRRDFPWGKEQHPDVTALVQRLATARQEHEALRRGSFETLAVDEQHWVYLRESGQDKVLVVINNDARAACDFAAALPVGEGTLFSDLITGRELRVAGGTLAGTVGARSAQVFVLGGASKSGALDPWVSEPSRLSWDWLLLGVLFVGTVGYFVWRGRRV